MGHPSQKNTQSAKFPRTRRKMLIDEEIFLQPWFVSKRTYLELRRILPSAQLLKMKYYFEDYGCLRCGRMNVVYKGNGLCTVCSLVIRGRVVMALARRFKKVGMTVPDKPIVEFMGVKTKKQVLRRVHYSLPGWQRKA
jgi:hypothetical protein